MVNARRTVNKGVALILRIEAGFTACSHCPPRNAEQPWDYAVPAPARPLAPCAYAASRLARLLAPADYAAPLAGERAALRTS